MVRSGVWLAGLSFVVAACASGDPSGTTDDGRQGNGATASGTRAGSGGAAPGAAGSGALGDLGNSDFDPGELPPPQLDASAGEECVPGMRCFDETDPDENDCGSLTLESSVETVQMPGNVLVIYDRSGSMERDWNGTAKYLAAGNALIAAMTPLQELLTVGGVFFPSLDPAQSSCSCNPINPLHWIPGPGACCLNGSQASCEVSTIDQPDQISFRPGAEFIAELPNQYRLQGAGNTPLQGGVTSGQQALMNATLSGPLTIVIVTDGAPNCGTDAAAVTTAVTQWAAMGIKTYVVGLPGAQDAALLLGDLAVAGGTGAYIDPADSSTLEMRLREILSETIREGIDSCTIELDPSAEAPEKLHLVVTENGVDSDVARDLSADAGWNISDDGATVTLEGRLCEDAENGRFEAVRFEFGCVDLPPLPPPPPPPVIE